MSVPLDIVQHEDRSRAGRERRDGPLEIERLVRIGESGWSIKIPTHAGEIGSDLEPDPPTVRRPAPLEDGVQGDAMQPGRKTAFAPEGPELLPHAHEDVPDQLPGEESIGTEPETEGIDPPHVRIVERGERAVIAALGRLYRGVKDGLPWQGALQVQGDRAGPSISCRPGSKG